VPVTEIPASAKAGGAEAVNTETWWGVRYRSSSGQHITSYGDEENARDEITRSNRLHRDMKATLLRREITTITTPWEEVPGEH
jgi:hypothetical protein